MPDISDKNINVFNNSQDLKISNGSVAYTQQSK